MSVVHKAEALLNAISARDVDALPPAERRRFADLCRHCAGMADRAGHHPMPKAGILPLLAAGERGH